MLAGTEGISSDFTPMKDVDSTDKICFLIYISIRLLFEIVFKQDFDRNEQDLTDTEVYTSWLVQWIFQAVVM